jgi:hypothetical protein
MPPKKAAKKHGSNARKAFEHLGRVQSIASVAPAEHESLAILLLAADAAFQSHHYDESAHLLRAAEHLLFAAVVDTNPQRVSRHLVQAVQEEFDHLNERAEGRGHSKKSPPAVRRIYARMQENAGHAMQRRDYRKALELARGAEALTHLNAIDHDLLRPADAPKKLKA